MYFLSDVGYSLPISGRDSVLAFIHCNEGANNTGNCRYYCTNGQLTHPVVCYKNDNRIFYAFTYQAYLRSKDVALIGKMNYYAIARCEANPLTNDDETQSVTQSLSLTGIFGEEDDLFSCKLYNESTKTRVDSYELTRTAEYPQNATISLISPVADN